MDNVLTAAATAIVQQGPFAALAYFLLRYILYEKSNRCWIGMQSPYYLLS